MTESDIDKLDPGEELDRLVAVAVAWRDASHFSPSRSLDHAMQAAEQFKLFDGLWGKDKYASASYSQMYLAKQWQHWAIVAWNSSVRLDSQIGGGCSESHYHSVIATHESPAVAICKAILLFSEQK
jgi:RimJ/RimL family protein N-acetyltransferase